MQERPLSPSERTELNDLVQLGIGYLRGFSAIKLDIQDTQKVVRTIQDMVEKLRGLSSLSQEESAMLPALGALWGHCIDRSSGWEWVHLSGSLSSGFALVSENREYACFPLEFVREKAEDPARDNSIALIYNMIRGGFLPPPPPDSRYSSLD